LQINALSRLPHVRDVIAKHDFRQFLPVRNRSLVDQGLRGMQFTLVNHWLSGDCCRLAIFFAEMF
jgi:hypothetical protein